MIKLSGSTTLAEGWGGRLTQARKFLKKTQMDIGTCIGVRNTAVSKWEAEAVEIDARSLQALQFILGINPAWVRQGEGPMVVSSWDEKMRESLTGMAGAPIDGVWTAGGASGMAPTIQPGDVVMWVSPHGQKMVNGAIYLVEAKNPKRERSSVASRNAKIGQAFPVEVDGGTEWLLYRIQDRHQPGSFPPLSLRDMDVIGQAVAIGRRLAQNLDPA